MHKTLSTMLITCIISLNTYSMPTYTLEELYVANKIYEQCFAKYIISCNKPVQVTQTIARKKSDDHDPLHKAVICNDLDSACHLLKHGAIPSPATAKLASKNTLMAALFYLLLKRDTQITRHIKQRPKRPISNHASTNSTTEPLPAIACDQKQVHEQVDECKILGKYSSLEEYAIDMGHKMERHIECEAARKLACQSMPDHASLSESPICARLRRTNHEMKVQEKRMPAGLFGDDAERVIARMRCTRESLPVLRLQSFAQAAAWSEITGGDLALSRT